MLSYWTVCSLEWWHVRYSPLTALLEIVWELLAHQLWIGSGEWAGPCHPEVDTFSSHVYLTTFLRVPRVIESNIQAQFWHSVKLLLDLLSEQTYFYSLCDRDEPSGWYVLPHLSECVVIQSIKAQGEGLLFTFYSKLQKVAGGELYPSSLSTWYFEAVGKPVSRSVLMFSGVNLDSGVSLITVSSTGLVSLRWGQFFDLSLYIYAGLFWNIQYIMTKLLFWKWMLKIEFNIFRLKEKPLLRLPRRHHESSGFFFKEESCYLKFI